MSTRRGKRSIPAKKVTTIDEYFPKPKKRGRPAKRKSKRGRPKKATAKKTDRKQTRMVQNADEPDIVDLTVKAKSGLDARLEGIIAKANMQKGTPAGRFARINWDDDVHMPLRKRIADSWVNKNDLYKDEKESFRKFAVRNGIDRNVLRRFLDVKPKTKKKTRGRPTHIERNVMRHLCEGSSMHLDVHVFLYYIIQQLHLILSIAYYLQSLNYMMTKTRGFKDAQLSRWS